MTETKTDVVEDAANFIETYVKNGKSYADSIRFRYASSPAEVVKVPEAVRDYIRATREHGEPLAAVLVPVYMPEAVADWLWPQDVESAVIPLQRKRSDLFARAWLAWPNVEVDHGEK